MDVVVSHVYIRYIYIFCRFMHDIHKLPFTAFLWCRNMISDTDLGGTKTHLGKTGKSLVDTYSLGHLLLSKSHQHDYYII